LHVAQSIEVPTCPWLQHVGLERQRTERSAALYVPGDLLLMSVSNAVPVNLHSPFAPPWPPSVVERSQVQVEGHAAFVVCARQAATAASLAVALPSPLTARPPLVLSLYLKEVYKHGRFSVKVSYGVTVSVRLRSQCGSQR